MPPKKQQAKKGPTYKASTASKDIAPAEVKEPPRQPKLLKVPQTFPQPPKNNQPLASLFEQWPTQQNIKAHDFGLAAEQKFKDSNHDSIANYLNQESIKQWVHLDDVQPAMEAEEGQESQKAIQPQSKNQVESLKSLENQPEHQNQVHTCIIETFMRPETEQEMQTRQKDEIQKAEKAAKDKKKAAKKEQAKEEGPIQVSDVKMSDITIKKHMPAISIWIGSQLQMIKQRNLVDVNSGEAVWKKIFPQENGVPQITKSGKYWVKLLYMGKYIKVEVDDRVPVNEQMRQLFPLSEKYNQKWTLILTKALTKYLSLASKDGIIGNGLVMYALTGMMTETISLRQFKEWQKLSGLMSNNHYEQKDVVVGCFSSNADRSFKKLTKVKVPHQAINQDSLDEIVEQQVDTKVVNGYSYCIGDYFDNGTFNMVFSQEKSQQEMVLKHEYNQMCKVTLTNKSREEKLEYRKKKKELKEKLAIEEKKRLEQISKAPLHYHFLKLLSNLQIQCDYDQKEILLAKKCVLNKMNQPPNYDIPLEKQEKDSKSMHSVSVSVIKYKEDSQLFPNIHDFSAVPNLIELLERKEEGMWIKDLDMIELFDSLQVLYNPNTFSQKIIENIESKKINTFTSDETKQILVVQKINQEEEEERQIRMLFGFSYQGSPHDSFSPYTILQKFDFDSFRATSKVVTLDKTLVSTLLNLKNQNSVFKLNSMSKGNYAYWVSADSTFKLLSIADYLTQFQGYTKKNLTVEYPPIEGGTYFSIAKLKLSQEGTQGNTILVKLLNTKEQLCDCLSYRLVTIPEQGKPMTIQQKEGIIKRNQQKVLLAHEYSRFTVEPGTECYLIVEVDCEDNIPDGSLELLLLSKNEGFGAESCQQVEPVKYVEKYIPNKYGIICRERIFTNSDVNSSFVVKLSEFDEVQGGGGGKGAKKGGKQETSTQLTDKPFTDKRNIIVKILKNDEIIFQSVGINEITIPNIKLQSTKANPSTQYYLVAQFDMRVWPESALKSEDTQKICWVTQVSSTDSIALVRDTKQEDKQKEIRKSWEDKQQGRAERAKKSRRRFLIQMKKENGEQLTEQEVQILNAPRLTKKQLMQQEKKNEDKKGGKGGKKDDKKGGKDAKKQEVVEEKTVVREPPKSKENFMNEIREFLQILQNCVVKYQVLDNGRTRIRSTEQIGSIREAARMAGQNRVGKLIRNVEIRQTMKIKQKEKKETVSIFFDEVREQIKQKYTKYIDWRTADMQKDKSKQDKQRFLIDIVSQEKPVISETDLKKNIAEYRQIPEHNPALAQVVQMVGKNIRIANLTQKINNLMAGWQIDDMKAVNEEINNDKIEGVDEQVMKQFKQMLEEVEKNPGIVAEKQAEAKKAKKGGKK